MLRWLLFVLLFLIAHGEIQRYPSHAKLQQLFQTKVIEHIRAQIDPHFAPTKKTFFDIAKLQAWYETLLLFLAEECGDLVEDLLSPDTPAYQEYCALRKAERIPPPIVQAMRNMAGESWSTITRTVLQETMRALIGSKLSRITVCMRNQALMQAGKAVSKLAEKSPLLQKIANPIQAFCAQAQEKAKHLVQSLHDAQKEKR